MRYRRLGRTNLQVSAIGFGGMQIPAVPEAQAIDCLNRALDLGVNYIDTARVYGDGEDKVGKVMRTRRDECILSSKTVENEAPGALRSLDESLKALQTDKIDIYCCHGTNLIRRFERIMMRGGAVDALKKARAQGKIDFIGFSSHWNLEMIKAMIRSDEFDMMIVPYNLVDIEGMGAEVIPLAKERDMGVVTMKPLWGGRLTTPVPKDSPSVPDDPILRGCLKFNLSNDAVSSVIPGMTTIAEAETCARMGDVTEPITEDEKRVLYEALGQLGKGFCLQCGYCMPCPEGVDIPRIYAARHHYIDYPESNYLGVNNYANIEGKPDLCNECGECEKKCPARLPIIQEIKDTAARIEPVVASRIR